jgi:phosphoribosyl 1,2-cyclic phosphodiesterase
MPRDFRMRLRFWGVRGSIPTPLIENLEFGGNTACVEIRLPSGEVFVFDGGTGIRELGLLLSREFSRQPLSVNLFLTHFHWDHIQGIPFFAPLYGERNLVVFHGHGALGHPEKMLFGQMQAPYFPVGLDRAPAGKEFVEMTSQELKFGQVTVRAFPLNHPQGALGYRVERNGASIVYASDLEHGDPKLDRVLRENAEGADILIYDAQYTPEEYGDHRGWGHSTWREAVRVASDASVGQLILFHHDPAHDSAAMRSILAEARKIFPATIAAREGWATDL